MSKGCMVWGLYGVGGGATWDKGCMVWRLHEVGVHRMGAA